MPQTVLIGRRATAIAWASSGALFALYPIARPFSAESGLDGARAFASPMWLVAHVSAIAALGALVLAVTGTCLRAQRRPQVATTAWGLLVAGVCLILPFYGAEAFGLHAIGVAGAGADSARATELTDLAAEVRGGTGLVVFLVGAALLAAGAIAGVATAARGSLPWWAWSVFASAVVLLVPQFALDQPLRIAHGLLYLSGSALFAWSLLRPADA